MFKFENLFNKLNSKKESEEPAKKEIENHEKTNKNSEKEREKWQKKIKTMEAMNIIYNLNEIPSDLHEHIASMLIKTGQGEAVAENLKSFQNLKHKEIAGKLIKAGQGEVVVRNFSNFRGLDFQKIILKIINFSQGENINYIFRLKNFLKKEVALALIYAKKGELVLSNLEEFRGLDKEVALALIKEGFARLFIQNRNLEKFKGLDKEVAIVLIRSELGYSVAEYFDKFTGINESDHKKIALEIIKAKDALYVLRYFDKFTGLKESDHREIVLEIIREGYVRHVVEYFEIFKGLDKEVAIALIKAEEEDFVVHHLEKFTGLTESDHREIVLELIKANKEDLVINHFEKFKGLNKEFILELIKAKREDFFVNNFEKFKEIVLDKEDAFEIIKLEEYFVATHLEKFTGINESDHKEVALALIKAGFGVHVIFHLEKFTGLDRKDIVLEIIKAGEVEEVIRNIGRIFNYEPAPETEVAKKKKYGVGNIKGLSSDEVVNIQEEVDDEFGFDNYKAKKITGLSMEELAGIEKNDKQKNKNPESVELKKKGLDMAIGVLRSTIIDLFESKKFKKIIDIRDLIGDSEHIISSLDEERAAAITNNDLIKIIPLLSNKRAIELFPKTITIAKKLILANLATNEDLADYFVENLDKYHKEPFVKHGLSDSVLHYSVAKKFLQNIDHYYMSFNNDELISHIWGRAKMTVDHNNNSDWDDEDDYYGSENEGFSQEDQFRDDPLRKIRSSLGLGRIMNGKTMPGDSELRLSAEAMSVVKEINGIIEKEHSDFLEKFMNNSTVSEEDKRALSGQDQNRVKMNNLLPNVRNFVGRYLAQLANGDSKKLSEIIISQKDSIKRMAQEGYRRYLKIYEVDIPLYDKLYEEFDYWRKAGRYPMEVYLGRDGVYAYIGRRAQDAARRSKVGKKKREQLGKEGEIIEINPKYLVYPRYFRDNINYETKREFLEQERISPDMDPLFYDTGYTGTIPEQIMHIMDFTQEDIEERIRLLSAPSAKRRVKGISENARSEIIEYIEHNAKSEESAVGLLKDEKTGKIRHIAKATNPEEQFYFMMIKQAIARHYMVQEKLHFEEPKNANFDSENYYIRIRQEYSDILPADFIKNPKQYFEQHGTLLKGSKGEGEYPDEEVLSFKLEDGTEVIAKRVELKKSKEARKEFMILIASKKAGLPTAEAVGFLAGKKEDDGSYLLMEKLEGYSGRKFEKYLQESGKFKDKEIKEIMKNVADKLKSLAQIFRDQLNIDKRWRIKDTIIQFNEESGEVENVIPIDWERVKTYDPDKPQKIDLVE